MPIRILIVDRYSMVREGLRMFLVRDLELEIVGEATDGNEAIEKARLLRPDLIVMDPLLPDQDGLTALATIRRELPDTQVIVLTTLLERASVASALRAGAIGYLTKDIRASDLRTALKAAAAGQIQLPPPASAYLLDGVQPSEFREPLTEQEKDILRLITKGYSNKEIAYSLHIVEYTLKRQVQRILAKLGVQSRKQAILTAMYYQLI